MVIGVCRQRYLLQSTKGLELTQPVRNQVFAKNLVSLGLLAIGVMISGCTPLIMTPTPVAQSEGRLIVQITYLSVDVLNELASELDIWEVDRAAQTLVARITLEQYATLGQQDLTIMLDCPKMHQFAQQNNLSLPDIAKLMAEECP